MTREEFSHSSSDTQANLELSEIAQLTDNGFPGCGNANPPATPGPRTPSVPLPCSRYRYSMSTTETRTFRSRHSRCCMGTAAVLLSLLTIGVFLGIMIHFTVIDVLWKDTSGIPKLPIPRADTSLGNTVPDFLGSVKISNLDWDYKLAVSDSLQYRDLAVRVEQELDRVFLLSPLKDIYNFSLVRTFRRGSIVAVFETVLTEHRSLTAISLKDAMTHGLDNRKYIRGPDDVIENKRVVVLDAESIQIVAISTTTLREETTTITLPMLINTEPSDVPTTSNTQRTSVNTPTHRQTVSTAKDVIYDHNDYDPEVTSPSPSPIPSWMWTPWRGTHFTSRGASVTSVPRPDLSYPHTISPPRTPPLHENVPVPVPSSSTALGPAPSPSVIHQLREDETSQTSQSSLTSSNAQMTLRHHPWNPQATQFEGRVTSLPTSPNSTGMNKTSTLTTTQRSSVTSSVDTDQLLDSIPALTRASNEHNVSTVSNTNSTPNLQIDTSVSPVSVPIVKPTVPDGDNISTPTEQSSKPITALSSVSTSGPTNSSTTTRTTNESDSISDRSLMTDTVRQSRNQIPDTDVPLRNTTKVSKANLTNVIDNIPDATTHLEHPDSSPVSERIPLNIHGDSEDHRLVTGNTTLIPGGHTGTRPLHGNGHGFAVRDDLTSDLPTTTTLKQKDDHTMLPTQQHSSNLGQEKGFWAEGDPEEVQTTDHSFPEDYIFTEHPDEIYDYIPRYPNNVANVFPNDADSQRSTSRTPVMENFEADDEEEHPEREVTEGIHDHAQFDDKDVVMSQNNSNTDDLSVKTFNRTEDHTFRRSEHSATTEETLVPQDISNVQGHNAQANSSLTVGSNISMINTHTSPNLTTSKETSEPQQVNQSPIEVRDDNPSLPSDNTTEPGVPHGSPNMSLWATSPPLTSAQPPEPAEYRAKVNDTRELVKQKEKDARDKDLDRSNKTKLSGFQSSHPLASSTSSKTSNYVTFTPSIVRQSIDVTPKVLSTVRDSVVIYSTRSTSDTVPSTDVLSSLSADIVSNKRNNKVNTTLNLSTVDEGLEEADNPDYEAFNLNPTPVLAQAPTSLLDRTKIKPTVAMTSTTSSTPTPTPTPTPTQITDDIQQTSDDKEMNKVDNVMNDGDQEKKRDKKEKNGDYKQMEKDHKEMETENQVLNEDVNEAVSDTKESKAKDKKGKDHDEIAPSDEMLIGLNPSSTEASKSMDGVKLLSSLLSTQILPSMNMAVISTSSVASVPVVLNPSVIPHNSSQQTSPKDVIRTSSTPSQVKISDSISVSPHLLSMPSDLQDLLTTTDELISVTSVSQSVSGKVVVESVSWFIDATLTVDTVQASVTPESQVSHAKEEEIADPYSPKSGSGSGVRIPHNACLDITVMTEFIPTCLDYFSQIMHTEDVLERCQHFLAGVICVTDEFYKYSGQQCTEAEISAFIKQHAGLFKNALPSFDPLQCVI